MNRPTDKQIEEVLGRSCQHRKMQNLWRNGLPQKKGTTYLDAADDSGGRTDLKAETAEIYVDHTIPSEKMYHQIQKNISRKQIKRICFRVAAILIPVILPDRSLFTDQFPGGFIRHYGV